MGHVTEDAPGIAHNLVGCMSFDVADEPDTTHRSETGIGGVCVWRVPQLEPSSRAVTPGGSKITHEGVWFFFLLFTIEVDPSRCQKRVNS